MMLGMDHEAIMDDLFGEADQVHLQPAPYLSGLNVRIDDLSNTACCQYANTQMSINFGLMLPDVLPLPKSAP